MAYLRFDRGEGYVSENIKFSQKRKWLHKKILFIKKYNVKAKRDLSPITPCKYATVRHNNKCKHDNFINFLI